MKEIVVVKHGAKYESPSILYIGNNEDGIDLAIQRGLKNSYCPKLSLPVFSEDRKLVVFFGKYGLYTSVWFAEVDKQLTNWIN